MFVREHTVTTRGKHYTYLELVENRWTDRGHRQHKVLGLGNKDAWPPDRLTQFRLELQRLEAKWRGQAHLHPLQGTQCWEYGETLALHTAWRRLHMDRHLQACLEPFKVEFDVAQASEREIIVVDESKLSPVLGTQWAVPIEVIPFGVRTETEFLKEIGAEVTLRLREDGGPFLTDSANNILDAKFGPIADALELAWLLEERAAIVTHGMFLGLATDVIVAGRDGLRELTAGRVD